MASMAFSGAEKRNRWWMGRDGEGDGEGGAAWLLWSSLVLKGIGGQGRLAFGLGVPQ